MGSLGVAVWRCGGGGGCGCCGGGAGRAATSWTSSSEDVPVTMHRQFPAPLT